MKIREIKADPEKAVNMKYCYGHILVRIYNMFIGRSSGESALSPSSNVVFAASLRMQHRMSIVYVSVFVRHKFLLVYHLQDIF
jgi:hypothetical protein